MAVKNPQGERSNAALSDDDDEPGGFRLKAGEASKLAGPMAATAAMPVVTTSEGIERLVALLAAKENELRALQKTHDEYVKSSCEYEKELEGEVERCEHKTQSFELQARVLEESKKTIQAALLRTQQELSAATKRESALVAQVEEMKWKIQRLEQTNDELETSTRVSLASIDALQHRVDTLTEENVFLLQEKEDTVAALASATVAKESASKIDQTDASRGETYATGISSTNPRMGPTRKAARLPEVVESCLHITCSHDQCRRLETASLEKTSLPGTTKDAGSKIKVARKSFFERMRLWARS